MSYILEDKVVLITGGTGSFGQAMTERLLALWNGPRKIIIYSRDEFKQGHMIEKFGSFPKGKLRFFIGDVRDKARLTVAFRGVDIVIHAAALKQVPLCEYNPFEAVKTNIIGANNVVQAAIISGVDRVMALSTDKAVNPVNLYGATKLCAEKIFVASNAHSSAKEVSIEGVQRDYTKFSVVRYGNVLASRGSVVQLFKEQAKQGELEITSTEMTRFWWTLSQSVQFVLDRLGGMVGGEIFVPKIGSAYLQALISALGFGNKSIKEVGIRPGEKIHEMLIAPEEVDCTLEYKAYYMVRPKLAFFTRRFAEGGHPVPSNFSMCSRDWLMTYPDLNNLVKSIPSEG